MRKSKVFVGSSNKELGELICKQLGVKPAPCKLTKFSNGETSVSIDVSVRDEDCYVVQSGSPCINDSLMELLILIAALKGGSATNITAVIPFFPYSKQSKMKKHRGAIAAKMIANLLTMAGVNHIITLDLHAAQMQGFFSKPVDNLYAAPILMRWIRHNIPDWQNAVVVSKNAGGAKRVTSMADALKINFAMINTDKRRRNTALYTHAPPSPAQSVNSDDDSQLLTCSIHSEFMTARVVKGHVIEEDYTGDDKLLSSAVTTNVSNEPSSFPSIDELATDDEEEEDPSKIVQEKTITLVGNVRNKTAILVDDIIDRPSSFIAAAEHCRKNCGAKAVYLIATHGIFSEDSLEIFENEWSVDRIITTNTFPIKSETREKFKKLTVIDVSSVLAECIRRNHYGESIASLFDELLID